MKTNEKTVKIAVITKQISGDDVQFIVHADGCQDIAKDVARHDGIVDLYDAESAKVWVKDEIESLRADCEGGGGWSERQFKIMPCAAKGAR